MKREKNGIAHAQNVCAILICAKRFILIWYDFHFFLLSMFRTFFSLLVHFVVHVNFWICNIFLISQTSWKTNGWLGVKNKVVINRRRRFHFSRSNSDVMVIHGVSKRWIFCFLKWQTPEMINSVLCISSCWYYLKICSKKNIIHLCVTFSYYVCTKCFTYDMGGCEALYIYKIISLWC